ncbi:Sec-independent protein translocase subunit TatA [Streptomyces sp. NPDC021093]|uniref:Sec-independent protein translocase subunit TatA n=1 Tax=Streptomyces sp. NPDC021093 TaxID=3365112 RepID=UPI0037B546E6
MLRNALEPWHLLVLAGAFILIFGSKKLPDTARALGKSLRILKSETKALKEESQQDRATNPAPDQQDRATNPAPDQQEPATSPTPLDRTTAPTP